MGVGVLVCLGGCGTPTTNSNYYNPAWMADGRIIAVRDDVTTYSNGFSFSAGGSSEHEYSIVVMNADGSGEHVVKGLDGNIPIINVSPSGNYIAHDDGANIAILDANYNRVGSIPWQTKGSVLYRFDWSPDETKLMIRVDSNTFLFSISGQEIIALTQIEYSECWKYGEFIIGYTPVGVALFDQGNNVVAEKNGGPGGYEYFSDGQYYFGANLLGGLGKVRLADFEVVETYPTLNGILDSIEYEHLQINPVTQTELMYSEPNSRLGHFLDYQGIWLINLDGSNQRRLRQ